MCFQRPLRELSQRLPQSDHIPGQQRRVTPLAAEWVFAVVALGLGIFSAVVAPPLAVQDEVIPVLRVHDVSSGRLWAKGTEAGWARTRSPASIDLFRGLYASLARGRRLTSGEWLVLARLPLEPKRVSTQVQSFTLPNWYVAFLPQGLAMAVGRACGLGPWRLIVAARLGSLLACVAIIARGIRLLPCLKWSVTALVLSPTCVCL